MPKLYIYETQQLEKEYLDNYLSSYAPVYSTDTLTSKNVQSDAEIISIFVNSFVTKEVLDAMPQLRCITTRSTGYDHIDMDEADRRGIVVTTVPSYGEHTVAEYAFGLLLSLTRKIPETIKLTKENVCVPPEFIRGMDLSGKVLGVIGTGRIGKKFISMGKGFGMNVIAYDPHEDVASSAVLGFTYQSCASVFEQADVISLHVPLTQDNHHLLNKDAFAQMKQGVYIINTARGELIDTHALIEALEQGKVAGAGLDVCEGEALLKKRCSIDIFTGSNSDELLKETAELSALKSFPNVVLTPHVAYDTKEAVERICKTTAQNISSYIHGSITNQVHKEAPHIGKLILARHTESTWNKEGKWTGTRDVHLTDKGFEDARLLGEVVEGIHIDHAFASMQVRTMETLSCMLGTMRQPMTPITRTLFLNERDYGDYTGKNKHDMKELLGDELFERVRRGFDVPVPGGETLKMVFGRVVPYYLDTIVPRLIRGENVLIVSHGNALRALIKYIEGISDEAIEQTEMMFGGAVMYRLNDEGKMLSKEIRETRSHSYDHV